MSENKRWREENFTVAVLVLKTQNSRCISSQTDLVQQT